MLLLVARVLMRALGAGNAIIAFMEIRPSDKQDVPQIIKLIGDIWAEYGCIFNTDIEEQYLLAPDEYFHEQGGEFWVVETDGRIVATVGILIHDMQTAELKSLYVLKDQRRSGLGERLTKMAMNFARERGVSEMILWSDTRFTKAHRLYERIGFVQTGQRELDDINKSVEYGFRISL